MAIETEFVFGRDPHARSLFTRPHKTRHRVLLCHEMMVMAVAAGGMPRLGSIDFRQHLAVAMEHGPLDRVAIRFLEFPLDIHENCFSRQISLALRLVDVNAVTVTPETEQFFPLRKHGSIVDAVTLVAAPASLQKFRRIAMRPLFSV